MTDETATCSSHNIYPAPRVTWATEPPSAQETLENSTIKTTDHRGLFHVESTLRILGNLSNHTYICSFTSADKTQVWTASWKNQGVFWFHDGMFVLKKVIFWLQDKFKKKMDLLFFRVYNTGGRSGTVHPLHHPAHHPEFHPHLDLHVIQWTHSHREVRHQNQTPIKPVGGSGWSGPGSAASGRWITSAAQARHWETLGDVHLHLLGRAD